jgi:hypothetical protein
VFETNDSPDFLKAAWRYFLQLLFCPVIILASAPFQPLLSIAGFSGEHSSQIYFAGYEGIVCIFVGVAVGWITGRNVRAFVPIGRWIWVLPIVVVFPGIAGKVLNPQPIPWLPEEFFATGDNEGVGVFLMLSACSAVGYSIGMAFAGTKLKWEKLIPPPLALTITVACVALFCLLTVFAHSFERSRIEMWSRVRTVIDRPGLSLSTDANQLCSTRTSAGGRLLQTGTMVEGLERRICFNRRVLDEDVQPPEGSWSVERVRVLTGSNGGAEGWVMTYGLMEKLQY